MHRFIRFGLASGALLAAIALGAAAATAQSLPQVDPVGQDTRPIAGPDSYGFGVYDPQGDFKDDKLPRIEHLFLPWEDIDLSSLDAADDYAVAHGRTLLITVEPWSWDKTKRLEADELRQRILGGRYDGNVAAVCGAIAGLRAPVMIRWAQEMEVDPPRFSWSNWAPADYIKAYRNFVETCRPLAPKARFMWSPRGEAALDAYYPGDDVVDDIGLSVFGLQAYDRKAFGHDRSFAEIFAPSYERVLKYNKPIYVAELGYSGDVNYVSYWARTVLPRDPNFPKLVAIVYFDDKDVVAWPLDLGVPNWRVMENTTPTP